VCWWPARLRGSGGPRRGSGAGRASVGAPPSSPLGGGLSGSTVLILAPAWWIGGSVAVPNQLTELPGRNGTSGGVHRARYTPPDVPWQDQFRAGRQTPPSSPHEKIPPVLPAGRPGRATEPE